MKWTYFRGLSRKYIVDQIHNIKHIDKKILKTWEQKKLIAVWLDIDPIRPATSESSQVRQERQLSQIHSSLF